MIRRIRLELLLCLEASQLVPIQFVAMKVESIIRRVSVDQVLDLRWKVLRVDLPFDSARFPDDHLPDTQHFATFATEAENASVICCASFSLNRWNDQSAWQLRGMAVAEPYRRQGIGRDLLAFAEQSVLAVRSTRWLWCNARLPAVKFYERLGWEIASERFVIETAGPHHKMIKPVG